MTSVRTLLVYLCLASSTAALVLGPTASVRGGVSRTVRRVGGGRSRPRAPAPRCGAAPPRDEQKAAERAETVEYLKTLGGFTAGSFGLFTALTAGAGQDELHPLRVKAAAANPGRGLCGAAVAAAAGAWWQPPAHIPRAPRTALRQRGCPAPPCMITHHPWAPCPNMGLPQVHGRRPRCARARQPAAAGVRPPRAADTAAAHAAAAV